MQTSQSWRCAHDIDPGSPLNILLREFLPDVARLTHGTLQVSLHPDGELGGPDDMVDMLVRNDIQMHPVSGMILSRLTPVVAIEGFPLAYASSGDGCSAMAGPSGDLVRQALRALGIHAFRTVVPQGLNQIFSLGRSIKTASDLDGMRIRIGNSPFLRDLFGSLGCDPQPIDLQHISVALAEGRAEGVEMTLNSVERSSRHRYMDHVALVDIRFACFWMCVNLDAWQSLSPATQATLEARFEELVSPFSRALDRQHEESLRALAAKGYTITTVDRDSLRSRLRDSGFLERWRQRTGLDA